MWIKLKRKWMGHARGEVMNIKEGQAILMIERGTAEQCQASRETMQSRKKDTMVKKAPVQKG